MARQKSITDQIADMQAANEKLNEYEKLLDKAIQIRFGVDSKSIKKILKKNEESRSNFATIICNYFELNTATDLEEFLAIMCTESSKNYYSCQKARQ